MRALYQFHIPIEVASTANIREHWSERAKRAAKQKMAARVVCPRWKVGPLLLVKLTRVGTRLLDTDNLQMSLKSVRDGIAIWLKVDDASPLVEWSYAQDRGIPTVLVEVIRVAEISTFDPERVFP